MYTRDEFKECVLGCGFIIVIAFSIWLLVGCSPVYVPSSGPDCYSDFYVDCFDSFCLTRSLCR